MQTQESNGTGAWQSLRADEGAGTRTANVLVDILVEAGVDVVFGLPGSAIAPMHDALLDRPNVRVITTRHEAGAVFAAAAYARNTGKLGVVLVTLGPGLTNAITGLASAHCDGLPVLLLVGDVPRNNLGRRASADGSAQHLNVVAMTRSISKLALEVPRAEAAPAFLWRAIRTALSGRRGPVVLTLPVDVVSAPIAAPRIASAAAVEHDLASAHLSGAIVEAAHILDASRRPLIFAGSGARWKQGPIRLRELAERLQCPVMTTPKGKGVFPEDHPLSLGVFGYGGHPSASDYLRPGIDTLLVVGSGLDDVATDNWSPLLVPSRHFIQVDTEVLQLGRNLPVTLGIVGDANEILAHLQSRLSTGPRPSRELGVTYLNDPARHCEGANGRITPLRALWELQQAMPPDTIYTCDIGQHLLFAIHYLRINEPDSFQIMTGLGSMGSAIAAAMGARLAQPKRPVVAVCGDGGFGMALGDLATAVRECIPIVVFVMNDFRYGLVEIGHEAVYGRRPDYPAGPIDIVKMARSVGAVAFSIERAEDPRLPRLLGQVGVTPAVIDVHIDTCCRMVKSQNNASQCGVSPTPRRELVRVGSLRPLRRVVGMN